MRKLLVCLIMCAASCAYSSEPYFVTRVIDGDTIKVVDMHGMGQTVRFIGIDTPESIENEKAHRDAYYLGKRLNEVLAAGREAKAYVEQIIPRGSRVTIKPDGRGVDDYGRTLAYVVSASGRNLNESLLEKGYAVVFDREVFEDRDKYLDLENTAKIEKVGFWSTIWSGFTN